METGKEATGSSGGRLNLSSSEDHLHCVINTGKDGGLVPINGAFYESYEDAYRVYEKVLREIFYGEDTYGALLIYKLVFAGPPEGASIVP